MCPMQGLFFKVDRRLRPVVIVRPSSAAHVRTWTTARTYTKGRIMNWNRIAHAPIWAWGELVWYFKWWVCVIIMFFHKLYDFGEWILDINVKLINLHDHFWEEIEYKIENWGEWNELD